MASHSFLSSLIHSDKHKNSPHLSRVCDELLSLAVFTQISDIKEDILIIVSSINVADQLANDLFLFYQECEIQKEIIVMPDVYDRHRIMPDKEILRVRLAHETLRQPHPISIATAPSLFKVAIPDECAHSYEMEISLNDTLSIRELTQKLVEWDYDDELEVNLPGEFSVRGGIVDLFSPSDSHPIRIEFFGNKIDSIRYFSIETQRTTESIKQAYISAHAISDDSEEEKGLTLLDCFKKHNIKTILCDKDKIKSFLKQKSTPLLLTKFETFITQNNQFIYTIDPFEVKNASPFNWMPFLTDQLQLNKETGHAGIELAKSVIAEQVKNRIKQGFKVYLLLGQAHHKEAFYNWLKIYHIDSKDVIFYNSKIRCGMENTQLKELLLTEREIFYAPHRKNVAPSDFVNNMKKIASEHLPEHYADIEEGGYVVHLLHGVARYRGLTEYELNGVQAEAFILEFEDEVKLYVPICQAGMISRYAGGTKQMPSLAKLGGKRWDSVKIEAISSMRKLASDLLRLQAVRQGIKREPFPHDSPQQSHFEHDFPYQETVDQISSIHDVKMDLESEKPMDRLVCGDVGYGKTEVAIRAIFKVIDAGKQVAFLVPTTILAQQHYYTLLERFSPYPFIVEVLSRFRSHSENLEVLQKVATGGVDVVVGTHRLLQKDVAFKNIGLIIIDEEQKFGVEHKERLKMLRMNTDVLTLSATPIPRTLYMSMSGLRDLSTLVSPPAHRFAVETTVSKFDERLIIDAIRNEVERGGQVFFLHNRVKTIDKMCAYLHRLMPEISFEIGHGQMDDHVLEEVMNRFIDNQFNVLVCTTIIESGVDIQNANTIIIDQAQRFGLSELYQLRGRVGRWTRQAYAYFLLPEFDSITTDARKRMDAIRKYTQLGSGFKLAMRDLEIRGSGSLLGAEQSGHITKLGFELYCRLLKSTVAQLKGKTELIFPDSEIDLSFVRYAHKVPDNTMLAVSIPPTYMPSPQHRIDFYRQLANCNSRDCFQQLEKEMIDRFGRLPTEVINLIQLTRIRLLASMCKFIVISQINSRLRLVYGSGQIYADKLSGLPKIDGKTPNAMLNSIENTLSSILLRKNINH